MQGKHLRCVHRLAHCTTKQDPSSWQSCPTQRERQLVGRCHQLRRLTRVVYRRAVQEFAAGRRRSCSLAVHRRASPMLASSSVVFLQAAVRGELSPQPVISAAVVLRGPVLVGDRVPRPMGLGCLAVSHLLASELGTSYTHGTTCTLLERKSSTVSRIF